MKVVTANEMRALDRRTIEEAEVPGSVLMDRAGQGVADGLRRLAEAAGFVQPRILFVAGRGNNAGDAFVAARYLSAMGLPSAIWMAGTANQLKGDALEHFSLLNETQVAVRELPTIEDWEYTELDETCDIIVDGLLGTGTTGPARGPAAAAIEWINRHAPDALVASIDLPSGLDADTGVPAGNVVQADLTITMALPKLGLLQPAALPFVGALDVVDIGIPREFLSDLPPDRETFVYVPDLREVLPNRARHSHKGSYGHILLAGGAVGYAGAVVLAAKAALRSGVGLVTVAVPEPVYPVVASQLPEAMVFPCRATEAGSLARGALTEAWGHDIDAFDAVLVGPGMTQHEETRAGLLDLLPGFTVPVVVDADALNAVGAETERLRDIRPPVAITPHPGEAARLLGTNAGDIQANRRDAVCRLAEATGATVILKGAGTLIAEVGRPPAVNLTGNPGMATGGTGDVLAGLLTGFMGQGHPPWEAAQLAVYLHGRAGDLLAWRKSQAGLTAGELADEIPYAFRDITLR